MPYICLARNDIPDGTLQVLDLWPNTSLRNQSIDPPGQTRYVNRTQRSACAVDANTGLVSGGAGNRALNGLTGLEAYLLDRVEPGATEQAAMNLTMTGVQIGDTVTINGTVFTAAAAQNIPAQEFDQSAGDGATATSLGAVLSASANIDLMRAGPQANVYAAPTVLGDTVTLAATFDPDAAGAGTAATAQIGSDGDIAVVVSEDTRTIPSNTLGRLARTSELWTEASLSNTAIALQARVDAGSTMLLADVNGVLPGSDLDGTASNSTGTLLELLSIMAGKGYTLPVGSQKFTAATAPDSAHVWSAAQLGGFNTAVQVFDAQMLGGEIRPLTPFTKFPNNAKVTSQVNNVAGGDAGTPVPVKDVRYNVDGDAIQASLQSGALSRMQDGTADLFPDSDYSVFHGANAVWSQPGPQQAAVNNVRLVTVYDNDGSLL